MLRLLPVAAVLLALGVGCADPAAADEEPAPDLSAAMMADLAEEIKTQMGAPRMLDTEPELVDITGADKRITYHYRMVNFAATDFEPGAFLAEVKPVVVGNVCRTPEMKELLDNGGGYSYAYAGKEGTPIGSLTVWSTDCFQASQ